MKKNTRGGGKRGGGCKFAEGNYSREGGGAAHWGKKEGGVSKGASKNVNAINWVCIFIDKEIIETRESAWRAFGSRLRGHGLWTTGGRAEKTISSRPLRLFEIWETICLRRKKRKKREGKARINLRMASVVHVEGRLAMRWGGKRKEKGGLKTIIICRERILSNREGRRKKSARRELRIVARATFGWNRPLGKKKVKLSKITRLRKKKSGLRRRAWHGVTATAGWVEGPLAVRGC